MVALAISSSVISEIVLTRGWTEEESANVQSSVRRSSGNVQAKGDFPEGVYKKMTDVSSSVELKKIEMEMVGVDQFRERADRLVEKTFIIQNK